MKSIPSDSRDPLVVLMCCPEHRLHSAYSHAVLRSWNSVPKLEKSQLIYPLFITQDDDHQEPIVSLPGQFRWGMHKLVHGIEHLVKAGLKAVLLFGVVSDASLKDATGSFADREDSPVIRGIKALRAAYPDLLVITDLCLCAYTYHGHCGIIHSDTDTTIDNTASIKRLAEVAVKYAAAGAQVIAPSDMMDGRIGAIKAGLAEAGFATVPVMSYAAKFQSCFYGPFRDAAGSGMKFGDRSGYQLPPGSRGLALRAVDRDIAEGADFVMVKPGMAYLDVIRDVADRVNVPVAVYQVSGEYAMLYHGAAAGAFTLKSAVLESMQAFQRAGATIIITYFAPELLEWLA